MKILITGGSGLLGQYLNIALSSRHDILSIYDSNSGNCKEYNSIKLDICDNASLIKVFNDFKPDVVVHTAAYSKSILSEGVFPKSVYNINVTATKHIAELCEKFKSKLIYTSTDLVYAGYRGSMLNEDAKLLPASLYAETKLMGEVKIRETFDNFIILRTALLFGFGLNHSKNHFQNIYSDLQNGKTVKLFTDQYRSPISLIEAARIICELVSSDIKTEIINFGGLERVSRYELGERLCEIANFDKNLLTKITMDDATEVAKVEDVSMNTNKLRSFGFIQKTLDEMILETIKK